MVALGAVNGTYALPLLLSGAFDATYVAAVPFTGSVVNGYFGTSCDPGAYEAEFTSVQLLIEVVIANSKFLPEETGSACRVKQITIAVAGVDPTLAWTLTDGAPICPALEGGAPLYQFLGALSGFGFGSYGESLVDSGFGTTPWVVPGYGSVVAA
jgi:hypothetical protein